MKLTSAFSEITSCSFNDPVFATTIINIEISWIQIWRILQMLKPSLGASATGQRTRTPVIIPPVTFACNQSKKMHQSLKSLVSSNFAKFFHHHIFHQLTSQLWSVSYWIFLLCITVVRCLAYFLNLLVDFIQMHVTLL